jgi:hypothetical protein
LLLQLQVLSNLTILGISTNRTDRIGVRLRKQGFRPKHPVVIVPGAGLAGHAAACFHVLLTQAASC